jgi:hypothetical protein
MGFDEFRELRRDCTSHAKVSSMMERSGKDGAPIGHAFERLQNIYELVICVSGQ